MEDEAKVADIGRVSAYRIAIALSDETTADAASLRELPEFVDIAPQLVRAVGSIAANVAEGWSRRSARDRIRFYEYALGSANEAGTWLRVARSRIGEDILRARLARLTDIRRLLITMIRNERTGNRWSRPAPR